MDFTTASISSPSIYCIQCVNAGTKAATHPILNVRSTDLPNASKHLDSGREGAPRVLILSYFAVHIKWTAKLHKIGAHGGPGWQWIIGIKAGGSLYGNGHIYKDYQSSPNRQQLHSAWDGERDMGGDAFKTNCFSFFPVRSLLSLSFFLSAVQLSAFRKINSDESDEVPPCWKFTSLLCFLGCN